MEINNVQPHEYTPNTTLGYIFESDVPAFCFIKNLQKDEMM